MSGAIVYGDPHGRWLPLFRACDEEHPDGAVRVCRPRLIVHGHLHRSYEAELPDGTRVRGLDAAEVFRIRLRDLP